MQDDAGSAVLVKRRIRGKTSIAEVKMDSDRVLHLTKAVSATAAMKRPATAAMKKPAAKGDDGLIRHSTDISDSFGKIRMHNSKKRSYIQMVLSDSTYHCLWSATFKDHSIVTPMLFEQLMQAGWTEGMVSSMKKHVALGGDPLGNFKRTLDGFFW